jgi:hypothetical protein
VEETRWKKLGWRLGWKKLGWKKMSVGACETRLVAVGNRQRTWTQLVDAELQSRVHKCLEYHDQTKFGKLGGNERKHRLGISPNDEVGTTKQKKFAVVKKTAEGTKLEQSGEIERKIRRLLEHR